MPLAPISSFRCDGSLMDLANPDPAEIDFYEMAAGLSKAARFNGRPNGPAYSVAQHSVMGADALYRETSDTFVAALFLLHDGHEYLLGDWPTPAQRLYAATLEALLPKGARGKAIPARAIEAMKASWDGAIYEAASLPPPDAWTAEWRDAVTTMDARMLAAEARALFGDAAASGVPAARMPMLKGAIQPWGAMKAEEKFLDAFRLYVGEERLVHSRLNHSAHKELSR